MKFYFYMRRLHPGNSSLAEINVRHIESPNIFEATEKAEAEFSHEGWEVVTASNFDLGIKAFGSEWKAINVFSTNGYQIIEKEEKVNV